MILARIVGTVVATRKTATMEGLPLRVVRRITPDAAPTDAYVVAVDVVGASDGELVLLTSGSAARNTHLTDARPCDAIIIAIVDTWQIEGMVKYNLHLAPSDYIDAGILLARWPETLDEGARLVVTGADKSENHIKDAAASMEDPVDVAKIKTATEAHVLAVLVGDFGEQLGLEDRAGVVFEAADDGGVDYDPIHSGTCGSY